MLKIALVFPPSNYLMSQKVFPYLGLLYLASELRDYKITIIDIGAGDRLDFLSYDIICYSVNVTQTGKTRELISKAKIKNPNIHQIVGGVWPSIVGDKLGADTIILGAGELALKKAIMDYENGNIKDSYYQLEQEIDFIKFPARDLVNLERYEYFIKGQKSTPIMSSRGCPFKCGFCSKNPYDKFRMRSVKNFSEEVDEIKSLGFSGLVIYDDTLNVNRERFIKICKVLKEKNMVWKCHVRSDLLDEELIKIMSNSNCCDVAIGFESGSNTILKNINKKTTVKDNIKVIELFKKYSITVRAYLILGLPGETNKTIRETEDWLGFCISNGLISSFGLGNFMPYPGSPIYENMKDYDIIFDKDNFDFSKAWYRGKLDNYPCFVSTNELSSGEIAKNRDRIAKKFKDFC